VFPLIPLPIIEAILSVKESYNPADIKDVSINSTSNNRSDSGKSALTQYLIFASFPLIPLPIIEAI